MWACLLEGSGIAAKGGHNESDLLHEIDKALRIGRGFLLEQGACAILLHHRQCSDYTAPPARRWRARFGKTSPSNHKVAHKIAARSLMLADLRTYCSDYRRDQR